MQFCQGYEGQQTAQIIRDGKRARRLGAAARYVATFVRSIESHPTAWLAAWEISWRRQEISAFMRIFKILFLLASIRWAIYSTDTFLFLAHTFPGSGPKESVGWVGFLSSMQGYLIVFAPLLISIFLLIVRWPEKR